MSGKQIEKQIERLKEILAIAVREKATDIQLLPGHAPVIKFPEKSTEYGTTDLTAENIRIFADYMLASYYEDIDTIKTKSFSYELENIARFRVTPFTSSGKLCLSIRIIPIEIKSFEQLNLPKEISNIAQLQSGLVLITGAAAQGKSTTISAILEEINRTREAATVITIEDPIEFTYKKRKAIITQREIGQDAATLEEALEQTLRHSPNVVMTSEIRNKESFEGVLTLAETGHLVISSIRTSGAENTILRILDYYNEPERKSIRNRLANSLKVIISQKLIRTAPSQIAERIPVCEILQVSSAVAETIRIANQTIYATKSFDKELINFVKEGKIEPDIALHNATDPHLVQQAYNSLHQKGENKGN
ncbi:MAG: ATPase, T2SS/T4P/T4SS family [Blastocatellia bacterium]